MKANQLLYGLAMAPALAGAQNTEKPNIIFVLCDDMGWGDLGCYGQQYISTPNIDRLAAEGMQFMQAYAGCPVSAPSRASLMTGQHTGHCKIRGNKEYWGDQWDASLYNGIGDYKRVGQEPLDINHVVLPEIMKDNGYNTAQFGKWAGGYETSESTPDKRGVDEFYGPICQFQAHTYYPNFLNKYSKDDGDEGVTREIMTENIKHKYQVDDPDYYARPQYSADLIHQKAMAWIDKQTSAKPFYGLFTYTLPHAELVQPEDSILLAYRAKFCDDTNAGQNLGSWYHMAIGRHAQFAGMITRLDAYVGEIMAKLEEKGLAENTILIFSSDNGPHEEGGADPDFFNRDGVLRGLKRSCHEGGIRIPFVVRWPGKVPAGVKNDHQLAFYDIMPTFCDIIGVEDYVNRYKRTQPNGEEDYFDGISFLPTLLGKDKDQVKHDYLYWEIWENYLHELAVRQGDWKLIYNNNESSPRLYDLATDIHEDNNLAGDARYADKLKELKKIAREARVGSTLFPFGNLSGLND
ncbi:MAG: arylsulfatase [Prevotella sp.]|nr:arylsulfatase [Prevotella sp.]